MSVPWLALFATAGIAMLLFVGSRAFRGKGTAHNSLSALQAEPPPVRRGVSS